MKRWISLLLFVFAGDVLFATPTGNPSFPKILNEGFFISPSLGFSLRMGYEGDFVFDRRLKMELWDINEFSYYLNSAVATLNILNRLDLFGTVGSGRLKTSWLNQEFENAFSYLELESRYDLAWSVGTKIIFFEWGRTVFSLGGRYFYSSPEPQYLSKDAETFHNLNNKITFEEWQFDAGLSYKIDIFVPYLCGKYSKAKVEFDSEETIIGPEDSTKIKMKSKDLFGLALGLTISTSKYFMLNAEIRLVDEEGCTVSADFRF